MGFLDIFGAGSLDHDFRYTPATWDATIGEYAGSSGDTRASIRGLGGIGSYAFNQAKDMMDPSSSYNEMMRGYMRSGLSDQAQELLMGQNRGLAARGIGGGGLSNILGASSQNRVGEQAIRAMIGLQGQQVGQSANLLGLSTGAYGQMGSLAGAESGRGLQMNLANLSAQNAAGQYNAQAADAARQYQMTSAYNQAAGNRAARGQFMGNIMGLAGNLMAPGLGSLMSAGSGGSGYSPQYGGNNMYSTTPSWNPQPY